MTDPIRISDDQHNNAPAVPQGWKLAPVWLLERVERSLGSFTSDEGWAQSDMDTMDSVSALLAATPAPAPAPAQGEPFGYFRAEPFGWTDCSEDAEGAIALYEHPAHEKHWTENEPVRLPSARTDRVYLAGPMTGIAELNFPAFNREAERLRAEGLQVLNPADHGIVDGADWADYLRHDIAGLASCERIHLLRGWTKSKGACLEMTIAKALGMTVTYQVDAEIEHNNATAVPLGYINAGHLHEMQSGRLPYAYLYAAPGVGVEIPVYTSNAPAQDFDLTDEEIEAIAQKHMSTVGDHWSNEEAIRERHAEDFARAIIAALRAKGQA